MLAAASLHAQTDPFEAVGNAIKSGNATALSQFFGKSVELTILDKEETYSGTQAEFILKDFFKQYPPKSFAYVHRGKSNNMEYAIGTYTHANGTLRTYVLIKKSESKNYVEQLRFETD